MNEWLFGTGWRYAALTVVVALAVNLPLAVANALSDWAYGVTVAVCFSGFLITYLFGFRRDTREMLGAGRRSGGGTDGRLGAR